jgi:hypothetical protein
MLQDPLGLYEIYATKLKENGGEEEVRFFIVFESIPGESTKALAKFKKLLKRGLKWKEVIGDTITGDPATNKRPWNLKDIDRCLILDQKLYKEFLKQFKGQTPCIGAGCARLTYTQMLSYLNSISDKYEEVLELYDPAEVMLKTAKENYENTYIRQLQRGFKRYGNFDREEDEPDDQDDNDEECCK